MRKSFKTYEILCKDTNILLAENCPKAKKAFELKNGGVVLGIGFDSSNLTKFLAEEKANKVIKKCLGVANAMYIDLKRVLKTVPDKLNAELRLVAKIANSAKRGLPIAE